MQMWIDIKPQAICRLRKRKYVDDASQQTEDLSTEVICLLTLERILMMAFIGIDDGDGDDDGNVAHF